MTLEALMQDYEILCGHFDTVTDTLGMDIRIGSETVKIRGLHYEIHDTRLKVIYDSEPGPDSTLDSDTIDRVVREILESFTILTMADTDWPERDHDDHSEDIPDPENFRISDV